MDPNSNLDLVNLAKHVIYSIRADPRLYWVVTWCNNSKKVLNMYVSTLNPNYNYKIYNKRSTH
ncbi:hypothetical protein LguiA_001486 [Lonicera macranthoides]